MENAENKSVLLNRQQTWHRPYYLDGGQVDKIMFYNEDGIIFEVERGWLENTQGKVSRDVEDVYLETGIVKRVKENLTRKENFYLCKRSRWNEPLRHVYIYVDGENVILKSMGKRIDKMDGYNGKTCLWHYELFQLTGTIAKYQKDTVVLKQYLKTEYVENPITKEFDRIRELCNNEYISISDGDLQKLIRLVKMTIRKTPITEL